MLLLLHSDDGASFLKTLLCLLACLIMMALYHVWGGDDEQAHL